MNPIHQKRVLANLDINYTKGRRIIYPFLIHYVQNKCLYFNLKSILDKRKNSISIILCIILCIYPSKIKSQTDSLSNALTNADFENVRVLHIKNELFVSLEDNLFRWNVQGISSVLDIISKSVSKEGNLHLYLLKKGIPQISLQVSLKKWHQHKNNLLKSIDIFEELQISYKLDKEWKTIKKVPKRNKDIFKADVVVYPQFATRSTNLNKIYEVQLNLAPALELSCWKGMKFTGQIILPIVNQLNYEGDFVRLGFVTISQNFRLPQQWFGRASIGNFNANRYGADMAFYHPFSNSGLGIGMNAGLTGSSYFYEGQWIRGNVNTFTYFLKANYYYPKFNLRFDFSYGKYLSGDNGVRFDCTRYFGETAIGFYAMYSGGDSNGGFHFAIPFPPRKRNRKKAIRIVSPKYFDWEYNAGTEFYYGRYYETQPNENRVEHYFNPKYLINNLIK